MKASEIDPNEETELDFWKNKCHYLKMSIQIQRAKTRSVTGVLVQEQNEREKLEIKVEEMEKQIEELKEDRDYYKKLYDEECLGDKE